MKLPSFAKTPAVSPLLLGAMLLARSIPTSRADLYIVNEDVIVGSFTDKTSGLLGLGLDKLQVGITLSVSDNTEINKSFYQDFMSHKVLAIDDDSYEHTLNYLQDPERSPMQTEVSKARLLEDSDIVFATYSHVAEMYGDYAPSCADGKTTGEVKFALFSDLKESKQIEDDIIIGMWCGIDFVVVRVSPEDCIVSKYVTQRAVVSVHFDTLVENIPTDPIAQWDSVDFMPIQVKVPVELVDDDEYVGNCYIVVGEGSASPSCTLKKDAGGNGVWVNICDIAARNLMWNEGGEANEFLLEAKFPDAGAGATCGSHGDDLLIRGNAKGRLVNRIEVEYDVENMWIRPGSDRPEF